LGGCAWAPDAWPRAPVLTDGRLAAATRHPIRTQHSPSDSKGEAAVRLTGKPPSDSFLARLHRRTAVCPFGLILRKTARNWAVFEAGPVRSSWRGDIRGVRPDAPVSRAVETD